MVYNLIDNAIRLSHESFHEKNINFVKTILLANDYPPEFIQRFYKKRLYIINYQNSNPNHNFHLHSRNQKYIAIPYNNYLFNNIKNTCFNSSIFTAVPKIKYQLPYIIKKGKDKIPYDKNTNIVYKINCLKCEASYVGEAKGQLNIYALVTTREMSEKTIIMLSLHIVVKIHTLWIGKMRVY